MKAPAPLAVVAAPVLASGGGNDWNQKLYHRHRPKSSPEQREKRSQMTKNTNTISIFELYISFSHHQEVATIALHSVDAGVADGPHAQPPQETPA
eukprot:505609-Amphidinium_carterae.1